MHASRLPFPRLFSLSAHCGLLCVGLAALAAAAGLRAQTVDDIRRAYGTEPPDRVEALLQAALSKTPNDPALLLFAGEIRSDRGQAAQAEAFLRKVLAAPAPAATHGRAHVLLGRTRYQVEDYAGARAQLDSARAGGTETAQVAAWYTHLFGLDQGYASWRTLESEHIRLHLEPGAELDADEYLRSREAAVGEVQGFFQAKLPKKIDVYMWSSSQDAQATGLAGVPFARPIMSLIHTRPGLSRGREIARVAAYWAALPWRTTRLVSAGTAVCFDLNPGDRLASAREVTGANAVSIADLWADRGTASEAVMHAVGGVLVQRLIERGGRDRFLAFLPDQSLENARRVYGATLAEIIAETERDLAAPPADAGS